MILRAAVLVAILLSAACSAAEYVVSPTGDDANPGSPGAPWRTLKHAAATARAGETVWVEDGTYNENRVTVTHSGSDAAHRITFIARRYLEARLHSTDSYSVFRINGDYVDVIGFDVAGDPHSCLGIVTYGSHTRVLWNHVHDIPANVAVCTDNGGAGIDQAGGDHYDATDLEVSGNIVHDIGGVYPAEDDRVHGIYVSVGDNVITNNLVYRITGTGLQAWHAATRSIIAFNTVFHCVYAGIYVGNGDAPGNSRASGMLVANNISVNNTRWGILEYEGIGPGNVYERNILAGNKQGAFRPDASGLSVFRDNRVGEAGRLFEDFTGDAAGDYRLYRGATAIGAGNGDGGTAADLNGSLRPNPGWDIGAYQFGSLEQSWPRPIPARPVWKR